MRRTTRNTVKVEQGIGIIKNLFMSDLSDKLLNLILNGTTLMSVDKATLRVLIRELYEKLAEFEDKQEKGLLIELPCKVGDIVYIIPTYENSLNEIVTGDITGFAIGDNPVNNININLNIGKRGKLYQPSFDDFGKTVFTTREQAEKALEKLNEA